MNRLSLIDAEALLRKRPPFSEAALRSQIDLLVLSHGVQCLSDADPSNGWLYEADISAAFAVAGKNLKILHLLLWLINPEMQQFGDILYQTRDIELEKEGNTWIKAPYTWPSFIKQPRESIISRESQTRIAARQEGDIPNVALFDAIMLSSREVNPKYYRILDRDLFFDARRAAGEAVPTSEELLAEKIAHQNLQRDEARARYTREHAVRVHPEYCPGDMTTYEGVVNWHNNGRILEPFVVFDKKGKLISYVLRMETSSATESRKIMHSTEKCRACIDAISRCHCLHDKNGPYFFSKEQLEGIPDRYKDYSQFKSLSKIATELNKIEGIEFTSNSSLHPSDTPGYIYEHFDRSLFPGDRCMISEDRKDIIRGAFNRYLLPTINSGGRKISLFENTLIPYLSSTPEKLSMLNAAILESNYGKDLHRAFQYLNKIISAAGLAEYQYMTEPNKIVFGLDWLIQGGLCKDGIAGSSIVPLFQSAGGILASVFKHDTKESMTGVINAQITSSGRNRTSKLPKPGNANRLPEFLNRLMTDADVKRLAPCSIEHGASIASSDVLESELSGIDSITGLIKFLRKNPSIKMEIKNCYEQAFLTESTLPVKMRHLFGFLKKIGVSSDDIKDDYVNVRMTVPAYEYMSYQRLFFICGDLDETIINNNTCIPEFLPPCLLKIGRESFEQHGRAKKLVIQGGKYHAVGMGADWSDVDTVLKISIHLRFFGIKCITITKI